MLFKTLHPSGRKLVKSRPLLIQAKDAYVRPGPGPDWFMTTTTVWRVDDLIKRRVRDWRRLLGEDGHTGERTGTMRVDHNSKYTGTHSVFAAPLMEWIILRYGGEPGGKILDAFAGGPPRGVVSSIMGMEYHGCEIRQEQIDENLRVVRGMGLTTAHYHLTDGRFNKVGNLVFDCAITCPPYHSLEVYSDLPNDLSNMSYDEFNGGMWLCAQSHRERMKPGAFVIIVVGNFRDKKGELIDFRSHTVENFRDAGFSLWQDVILGKNFASAAIRAGNAWRGMKLVPAHEHMLVFRTPGG